MTKLCYSLKRCCPERGPKIDMTLDIIRSLPDKTGAYVLMDSWYTNSFIQIVLRRGFQFWLFLLKIIPVETSKKSLFHQSNGL